MEHVKTDKAPAAIGPYSQGIIANGFFLLKLQADQWVVASSFPPAVFALISIAAVVLDSAGRFVD